MQPGHQESLVISSNGFIVATLSLYALLGAVGVVWEVLARRKAGPIRFRLPLASMAKPPRMPTWSKILLVLAMLMMLPAALISGTPTDLVTLTFFLWTLLYNLQFLHHRRQTIRWLVLGSGLISLVVAALLLASGLGVFQGSLFRMPWWFMLIFLALLLAGGAVTIWEGLSGTLVREHGLEIFGAIHPWPRIVVKDWQECDDGFALRLTVLGPRMFGMLSRRDTEMTIPVPAQGRPALQDFLGGRAATTGGSRLGGGCRPSRWGLPRPQWRE
jgi:hypothetical protein